MFRNQFRSKDSNELYDWPLSLASIQALICIESCYLCELIIKFTRILYWVLYLKMAFASSLNKLGTSSVTSVFQFCISRKDKMDDE